MRIGLIKNRQFSTKVMQFSFVLCLMIMVILPNSVFGRMNKGWGVLPEEMAAVPRWCQNKMIVHKSKYKNLSGPVANEYNKWAKVIGEDIFRYTHHYCMALNWINRYKISLASLYKNVEADREFALKNALSEFLFMRKRLQPKHKLYYSLLMNEAYVYGEQKNLAAAVRNYQQILKLKPGYAFAYVEYARLLNSVGKTEDAIKLLQSGLKKTKGAKIIKLTITAMKGAGANN